jgi:ribosome-associated translation inhibitor RaiA
MNLQILGDKNFLTPEIKDIIDEHFTKKVDMLLKNFDPELKTAKMRIVREKFAGGGFKVNFDITLPGKENLYSENHHHLFIPALVGLREQLEKQIKKYKSELTNYSAG